MVPYMIYICYISIRNVIHIKPFLTCSNYQLLTVQQQQLMLLNCYDVTVGLLNQVTKTRKMCHSDTMKKIVKIRSNKMAALNYSIFDFFFPMGFFFFLLDFQRRTHKCDRFFLWSQMCELDCSATARRFTQDEKGNLLHGLKRRRKEKILSESDKPRSIIVFTRQATMFQYCVVLYESH